MSALDKKISVVDTVPEKTPKKTRRKRTTTGAIKSISSVSEIVKYINPFEMPGVIRIILSDITQKIVGCVVGYDVTAEKPWTNVQKEKLSDNLDLHEDSSEFLPIAKELQSYPEKEVLVGWIPAGSTKDDHFYVVYTVEAKKEVLKEIERQDIEMQERLQRSLIRPVKSWQSLGSENEVNLSIPQNFRPLYEIEVESKFPLIEQPVHFKLRKVEDARDGYVELLPDPRYPITYIEKKRVDASVQASLLKVNTEAQTNPNYPKNVYTQYAYLLDLEESKEKEKTKTKNVQRTLPVKEVIKEITLSPEKINIFIETMYFNSNVNLYEDDYKLLLPLVIKRMKIDNSKTLRHFLSLTEVKTTKNNVACDASWYSFKSGLLAVCYAQYSFVELSNNGEVKDEVENAMHSLCPVLLWSYDDGLKPKLYLQSPREVTYLSFCPFRENLLIGGCKSGQIIVWDLTNKLEQAETNEILTYNQKRNRMNLWEKMKWMKNTHNIAEVEPVLISSLINSHTDMVTNLKWIHEDVELTKTGKWFIRKDSDKKTLAFMSVSIDGSILVWDLSIEPPEEDIKKAKRKTKRLPKVPSILTVVDSGYKKIQSVFKPYYKLIVKDGNNLEPMVAIIRKPNVQNYTPVGTFNPNVKVRTEFTYGIKQPEAEHYPLFVTTSHGKILKIKWSGYDYAPGSNLPKEDATVESYQAIHDGPIASCHIHPHYNDILMTVGGKIFAIWSTNFPVSLLWKKADKGVKYMSAGWTFGHPSYLFAIRSDGASEIWDLNHSSNIPLRILHLGGELKTNVLGALTGTHTRKGTFAVTDEIGSVTLYHLPAMLDVQCHNQTEDTHELFSRAERRKKFLLDWMNKFEAKYYTQKEQSAKQLVARVSTFQSTTFKPTVVREVEKMKNIFSEVKWEDKASEVYYETLLERKHLNIKELNKERQPLINLAMGKRQQEIKLAKVLSNKDKLWANTCGMIQKDKRIKTPVYSVHDIVEDTNFIADYDEIQKNMLLLIKNKPYKCESNFYHFVEESRQNQKLLKVRLNRTNIRNRRHATSPEEIQNITNIHQMAVSSTIVGT